MQEFGLPAKRCIFVLGAQKRARSLPERIGAADVLSDTIRQRE